MENVINRKLDDLQQLGDDYPSITFDILRAVEALSWALQSMRNELSKQNDLSELQEINQFNARKD